MNPRGILISPGPGKIILDVLFLTIESQGLAEKGKNGMVHIKILHDILSSNRCTPGFWDIIANRFGTWA